MAVSTSFKQECPSCEAMVLVKDASMIGKKIECPKCKDRFVVTKPAKKKIDEEEEDQEDEEEEPKPKSKTKTSPAKKTQAKPVEDDDDEEEAPAKGKLPAKKVAGKTPPKKGKEADDEEEKPPQKKGKAAKGDEEEAAEEDGDKKKKKKKGLTLGSKKLGLGLVLAIVGVLVLAVAGYFILFNTASPKAPVAKGPPVAPPPGVQPPPPSDKEVKKDDGKKEEKKDEKKVEEAPGLPLLPAGPELTNYLPPDTDQVVRLVFNNLMENTGPFWEAAFNTPGAFNDAHLKNKLGFSPLAIDELILAENLKPKNGWSFAVVHVQDNLNIKEIAKALNLEQVKTSIKDQVYYQLKATPWVEQLGRLSVGTPFQLRQLGTSREGRPLFVRLHNHQTLIVGDEEPVKAFLQAESQFRFWGEKDDAKKEGPPASGVTFMTIKPDLKKLLDDMQPKEDSKDRLLFATATDMTAAQVRARSPEIKSLLLFRPRPFPDITSVLEERQPRLKFMGTGLVIKKPREYQYRTDLLCGVESEAKDVVKDLVEKSLPRMTKFLEQILDFKIELPNLDPAAKPPEGTRFGLVQLDKSITLTLDLILDPVYYSRITDLLGMLMVDASAELALMEMNGGRQLLAKGANQAALKGLREPNVLPGRFPPGAFPRASRDRFARHPAQRISWMAGLLPYLGHDKLFQKIQFDSSWCDPVNWVAGRTVVPQFLDPSYPDNTLVLTSPGLPMDLAATHFVGIAGVGLDAADYPAGDPAFAHKRGILGYEDSASLDEVQKGRGLGNTILLIQVPPDGLAGVSPWIAGGGSTLRGVPEKNSIAPFVLTRERDKFNSRAGTYALMADGSVRFITKDVSDEAFQAMCTFKGPNPPGFDIIKDPNILSLTTTPKVAEKKTPEKK